MKTIFAEVVVFYPSILSMVIADVGLSFSSFSLGNFVNYPCLDDLTKDRSVCRLGLVSTFFMASMIFFGYLLVGSLA